MQHGGKRYRYKGASGQRQHIVPLRLGRKRPETQSPSNGRHVYHSRKKDIEGNDVFDIRINAVPSNFFGYVINSSRVYWRKELEYNFDDKSVGEAESYREKHKFDIEGEGLTAEEVAEQKRNLINKIFTIGYMLHRYKSLRVPGTTGHG